MSPVWFVIVHVDSCTRYSLGDFCDVGRNMMRRAQSILRETYIPPIPRSPNKA